MFNWIYYIPFFSYSYLIKINNNSNFNSTDFIFNNNNATRASHLRFKPKEEYNCYFIELYHKKVMYMMDLVNSTLMPFSLMFIFSILLIYTIFKSRLRILRLDSPLDRKRLRKDIKFALTCILLNVTFVILNLPVCIANLLTDVSDFYYQSFMNLFFCSFCINYYVLFFFNSVFRKEFLFMFHMIPIERRSFRE